MDFVYHHRTAGRGGEGLHIMHVVQALEAAGHQVGIVSPPGVDPRRTAGAVPLDKGERAPAGITRLWKWVSCAAPQLLFELAELAYNAFAAAALAAAFARRPRAVLYERYAFFLCAGVWVAKLFGRPVILEVNEVTGIERARPQRALRVMAAIERWVFARADHIVTVSSFLRDQVVARGGRPGCVYVVPNAIDPERFRAVDPAPVRARLGLDGCLTVGFVGWFDRWDRLDLLIDAVRELSARHPRLRLLLVGDGPVRGELQTRLERDGLERQVVLTGAVPKADVPAHIGAMDICVLPDSNRFGSPMVLFEFMAMARAVVAPDVPPVRDVVQDGETGLIVSPGAGSLQQALDRLLADPVLRSTLGQRARAQVLARHTWAATAARIVELAGEARYVQQVA
jgi:glycosyltransferase involved in cell wall biosynthesis